MGNRPINRRPFRRPPWRTRTKRPVRWIESNSHSSNLDAGVPWVYYSALQPAGTTQSPRIMLWGDDDLDWMDANEATVERTVGTITLSSVVTVLPGVFLTLPVVRMGILLCEELDSQNSAATIDLWERESVEEHEWLWLNQTGDWSFNGDYVNGGEARKAYRADVPLDLRVRRTMGKRDALCLYWQWGLQSNLETDLPGFDLTCTGHYMLRSLIKTK